MARHNIALIGLGMAVAPHAKSLLDLTDRVSVAAAFSPSAERRDAFAGQYAFPKSDDLDRIFKDRLINAVAILTPPNTHLELVQRAAAAGKHILLEKPLELTTARAEELVSICERAGVILAVTLQHRFRPAAERLAAILASGRLGKIINCSTTIRVWRPQSYYDQPGRGTIARDGGGVLLTQGIHTLDLMLSLAGPIAEVRGYAMTSPVHRMETEDMVAAAVCFNNGALGVIDATTTAYPGFSERIEMIGVKGTAVFTGSSLLVQCHDGSAERIEPDGSAGGTGADPMAFPHDWHRSAWVDFLDAIEERRQPRISGADGLRVHRLIDALLETARTGKSARVA